MTYDAQILLQQKETQEMTKTLQDAGVEMEAIQF